MPSDRLFGTDGVRGVAGEDVTPELAREVARAFATVLGEGSSVLMARDTRPSGPELAEAAAAGLIERGVTVRDCGVFPTGALCLLVRSRPVAGGVIISASHNPPHFNGVKLVGDRGHKLPLDVQHRVEELVLSHDPARSSAHPGSRIDEPDAPSEYLDRLFATLGPVTLDGLRVVLDCAHGAAGELAVQALSRAGARPEAINCDTRGGLINVECGSTHPAALARAVVERGADMGVAFDGDADRAVFADHRGGVADGDATKFLLAADLQERGLLDPPLVVGTVMNNFGLERALTDRGIELLRTPVGDRHVIEAMHETGALLGGEQSGHIVFRETMIGDGVYTALRVCEVVARTGRPLAELAAPVVKIPQLLVNVEVADRQAWRTDRNVTAAISRWEGRLRGRGRLLVRPSGTEPLVRIMVEADEDSLAHAACEELAALIASVPGS